MGGVGHCWDVSPLSLLHPTTWVLQGRHEDELPSEQPRRKSLNRVGAPGKTEWLLSCLGGQDRQWPRVVQGGTGMGV